jgi:ABC-type sugar transport system ATPase subunit
MPFLTANNISKRFGITQALKDVSVAFEKGEIHALMGENGAGKSTLGKAIAGLHKPDTGTITLDGVALTPGSIHEAFAAGIRIVHQELAQCPNLSVAENLCLHQLPRTHFGLIDRRAMEARAARLLRDLEPSIDVGAPLESLSPGHRQIVQIAASLDEGQSGSGASPARVIVFDEPTSSLSMVETERLLTIIRQLAAKGITCLYVSHRMAEIFAVCDRVTVLRDGQFIATSRIKDLDEPALVEQMIGRRLDPAETRPQATPRSAHAAAALEVRDIRSPGKLHGLSLSVQPGEILGIGGLVGAGRSELLDGLFGLDPRVTGRVSIKGQVIPPRSPRAGIAAGLGYVPEDRRLQGLFFQLGIDENILVPFMPRLSRFGLRSLTAERSHVHERLGAFAVKAASPKAIPGSLSGGNQQKLLIARWMTPKTKVLLLDEPTRGIDIGTKVEIYKLVRQAADRGLAVVLVSSEMPELLRLSDRIVVMAGGCLTGELVSEADRTQANVLRLATQDAGARAH